MVGLFAQDVLEVLPEAVKPGPFDNKDGISNSLMDISDERLNIPMKGNVESLNVSSSASVILFEVVRQRFR